MPQTVTTTAHGHTIAGAFSKRENAELAIKAFEEIGVSPNDIQTIVQLTDAQTKDVYSDVLTERGFADEQARYYDEVIRSGRILVVVYDAIHPVKIIDIFDKYGAEYKPNGSRDVRQDVLGMTTGAVLGAAALGVAGAVAAGPVGAAVGVAAGELAGAVVGAVAGKAVEHHK